MDVQHDVDLSTETDRAGSPPSTSISDAGAPRPSVRRLRPTIGILLPLQLFLAAGWLRAGVEKVIDPGWWSGAHLSAFLEEQRPLMLPWFGPFADHVVEPLAPLVAWAVVAVQLTLAGCLIAHRRVRAALWAGIVLNVSFTMAGAVNPSAFYLVMQLALLFALARPVGERIAMRRAVAWLVPAGLIVPFARTVDPAHVIEDPALMLSFVSLLAAVSTIAVSGDPQRSLDTVRASGRRLVASVTSATRR